MKPPVIRTLVAATDLTEASDDVLRAAAGLARRSGAAVHVVHAFDFPPAPYLEEHGGGTLNFAERIEDAERALEAQLARTVPAEVTVAGREVQIYAAHRAIVEYAAAVRADLIVLGPHTRRELDLRFLGGTADRVVRTAEAPVLVVRGPLRLPLRRVVVPVDLSERSGPVLDVAIAWGEALGERDAELGMPATTLDVVHVIHRALAAGMPFDRATVLPGVNREIEAALQRAGGAHSIDLREEVLWGDRPAEEIVRFAKDEGADLVVLATHGHRAFKRALIGSTSQAVARGAPCPVLLIPPRVWHAAPPEPRAAAEPAGTR